MYVRVKTTPNSPRKSVQIVQSVRTGNKVSQKIVRHVGVALDEDELEKLQFLAESIRVKLEAGNQGLLFSPEELAGITYKAKKQEAQQTDDDYRVNLKDVVEEQRVITGIHDVYGALFDELGYTGVIKNPARNKAVVRILRDIVLGRIANPRSKRATVDMLEENFGVTMDLDRVYRMMDRLDDEATGRINGITYKNTATLFQEKIDVIFFDCTTVYFETFSEDELRQNGYSKDLKFNQPQVLLALLVTREGLPIGYKVFEGSAYEGHTLLPSLREVKGRYTLGRVIIVADAGILSRENMKELESLGEGQMEYIVGCRLRNLPKKLQEQVLDHKNYREVSEGYKIGRFEYEGKHVVVSYSEERARKDAHDREKAIERLQKKLEGKKNLKEYLSNYGYKKFLKVEGKSSIELHEEKIKEDRRWDGLHGVVTNAKDLTNEEVLGQYHNLWNVEDAFRVTKHDLKVRPIFHWKPERVQAHLAISFIAYALVKHLEYRVKLQYKKLSPEKIRQSLVGVQTSILYDTRKKIRYGLPSRVSQDARKIYKTLNVTQRLIPYIIEKCSA